MAEVQDTGLTLTEISNRAQLVTEAFTFYEGLKQERSSADAQWQDIAETMSPIDANFIIQRSKATRRKLGQLRFDGTASIAAKRCSGLLLSYIAPSGYKWFTYETTDEKINQDYKSYFFNVTDTIFNAMYGIENSFVEVFSTLLHSQLVFGNGCIFLNESETLDNSLMRSVSLDTLYVEENVYGKVDKICKVMYLNYSDIRSYFPDFEGETLRRLYQRPSMKEEVVHIVVPNNNNTLKFVNPSTNRQHRFISLYIAPASMELLSESYLTYNPYIYGRSDIYPNSGSPYGYGIGAEILPNVLTLNKMEQDTLMVTEQLARPQFMAFVDDIQNMRDVGVPGKVVKLSDRGFNRGMPSVQSLAPVIGSSFPITAQVKQEQRQLILSAFMMDLLQSGGGDRMTEDEVMARMNERSALIAPYLTRVYSEVILPFLTTLKQILEIQGKIEPMPQGLYNRLEMDRAPRLKLKFTSPAILGMQAQKLNGMLRSLELTGNMTALYPIAREKLDPLKLINEFTKAMGVDSIVKTDNEATKAYNEMMRQQAEAEQAAQQQAMQQQLALNATQQVAAGIQRGG